MGSHWRSSPSSSEIYPLVAVGCVDGLVVACMRKCADGELLVGRGTTTSEALHDLAHELEVLLRDGGHPLMECP